MVTEVIIPHLRRCLSGVDCGLCVDRVSLQSPPLQSHLGDLVTKLVPRDWRLHELETCVRRGFIARPLFAAKNYFYDLQTTIPYHSVLLLLLLLLLLLRLLLRLLLLLFTAASKRGPRRMPFLRSEILLC
jgi:hypothetical protein